jgi:hypothetical protein
MCNFLTNTSFTARFESESQDWLALSLPAMCCSCPEGTGGQYPVIYEALDRAVASAHLARVVNEDLRAQCEPKARRIAAGQIICCLRNLKSAPRRRTAPSRRVCPRMCSPRPREVTFPHFHVRAYKREGQATFSGRENRRMARPRTRPRAPGRGVSPKGPSTAPAIIPGATGVSSGTDRAAGA